MTTDPYQIPEEIIERARETAGRFEVSFRERANECAAMGFIPTPWVECTECAWDAVTNETRDCGRNCWRIKVERNDEMVAWRSVRSS